MASDPPLADALRDLRAALYDNALRALSADSVGPFADLSRLDLGEADVGEALATALRGAKATTRVDFSGEQLGGDARVMTDLFCRDILTCFSFLISLRSLPARSRQPSFLPPFS